MHGHIEGNRALVAQRLEAVVAAVTREPRTAVQIVPEVYDEQLNIRNAAWFLSQTLCYLRHLELAGRVAPEDGGRERWREA
ncbi:MAG: hypothetical protein ACRDMJ_10390 [Solirubrobacteraceae bacterium]